MFLDFKFKGSNGVQNKHFLHNQCFWTPKVVTEAEITFSPCLAFFTPNVEVSSK